MLMQMKRGRYVNWRKWDDKERQVAIRNVALMIDPNKEGKYVKKPRRKSATITKQKVIVSTISLQMKGLSTEIDPAD